jgi:GST-like protein
MGGYVLYGGPMTGAVAVEAALVLAGQTYEVVNVYEQPRAMRSAAAAVPLSQVPALTFPDGQTMTESAAILLRLSELHPQARLAPSTDDPARAPFLRWMSFVAAAIYSHYWLKDDPGRLVPDPAQHAEVNRRIEGRILECWGIMEAATRPGRYILGDTPSVLDAYVTVVSRFRPRRQLFYAAAPRLGEVVRRLDADPRLADLWARRYPFYEGWDIRPPD